MQNQDATQAPGPGPRSPGGIVVVMLQVYARNVARMVSIAAVVMAPLLIAGWAAFGPNFMALIFSMPGVPAPDMNDASLAGIGVYSMLYALGLLAVSGATAAAVARRLTGSQISASLAYAITLRRLPHMLGVSIIIAIAVGVPVSVATVISAAMGGPVGTGILVVTAALAVYVAVKLMFALFVALLEQAGPLTALSRSWMLVSGAWLSTFGRLLLVSVVIAIVEIALQLAGSALPGIDAAVFALIVTPLTVTGNLLIYLDLRSRKETYTTERLATDLERLPS